VLVNPGNIAQTEATLLEVRDAARLTARALGIEAPETLLATADELIKKRSKGHRQGRTSMAPQSNSLDCCDAHATSGSGQNEPCRSLARHGRSTSVGGLAGPAVGASESGHKPTFHRQELNPPAPESATQS
jgi:hypothetical protein